MQIKTETENFERIFFYQSSCKETGGSRHDEDPIECPPNPHIALMLKSFQGALNWGLHMMPRDARVCPIEVRSGITVEIPVKCHQTHLELFQ